MRGNKGRHKSKNRFVERPPSAKSRQEVFLREAENPVKKEDQVQSRVHCEQGNEQAKMDDLGISRFHSLPHSPHDKVVQGDEQHREYEEEQRGKVLRDEVMLDAGKHFAD